MNAHVLMGQSQAVDNNFLFSIVNQQQTKKKKYIRFIVIAFTVNSFLIATIFKFLFHEFIFKYSPEVIGLVLGNV